MRGSEWIFVGMNILLLRDFKLISGLISFMVQLLMCIYIIFRWDDIVLVDLYLGGLRLLSAGTTSGWGTHIIEHLADYRGAMWVLF